MKKEGTRALAVVPAFNEEQNVPGVLRDLRAAAPWADVLVVDDGSSDATARLARELGAVVCRLPCNLGIGGAVQTGFLYGVEQDYDVAFQFDGDGQHVASEVPALVAPLLEGRADVVVGSRFAGMESYSPHWMRRLGIWLLCGTGRLAGGVIIRDVTSGFRAYNRKAMSFLASHYPSSYPEPEAIVQLAKQGFRIVEVPVEMRERNHGTSSISTWRSVHYMVRVMMGMVLTALRGKVR